ncbi:uncharacterized protein LOC133791813 [Humulus lupulus]|uniref:uncharacterized protein LOC133791813 n=1 Tax=Humulus lupulus TaxID=3486 RepID=UPI002B40F82F|nr:uncharacterized protein LOC133791813 [Humulus lupulus]
MKNPLSEENLSPVCDGGPINLEEEVLEKNWAADSEKDDFQASAQSHWANLRDKLLINEAANLHYEEPIMKNGKKVAQIDMAEIAEQAQNWSSAVICMVMGANPPFAVFEGIVKRIWGHLGIERVVRMNMGLTIVKFNDEATRDFVLENGIVHGGTSTSNIPVIRDNEHIEDRESEPRRSKRTRVAKDYGSDFCVYTLEEDPANLQEALCSLDADLWQEAINDEMELPNLGLQYWGKKFLDALVSTIEKPIMVDKFTKDRSMIRYARVLVEMEITEDPPFVIYFVNERGQVQEQFVEYEWLPIKCNNCKGFGHNLVDCKKNSSKGWVKKSATEQEHAGNNVVPEIAVTDASSGDSTRVPVAVKEVEEKHDESGIDVRGATKEKGRSQDHLLTPNQDNKENWEILKKVGNSKGRRKSVRYDLDNKQNAFKVLQEQRKINKVGFCALLENKMKKDKVEDMITKLLFGWEHYSSNVTEGLQTDIVVTFVYGLNTMVERLDMWRGLSSIHVMKKPWLVVGDFDVVFNFDDRMGGKAISATEILDSIAWLAHSQLASLKSIGSNFTWSNKQEGGDRIAHRRFKEVVIDSWHKPMAVGGLLGVTKKLLRLKHILKAFNREEIGDVEQGYHQAKGDYQPALTRAQASPTDTTAQEAENIAAVRYQDHYARYKSFFIQCSKVTWLQKGDDNNSYFHVCIKKRREENHIISFLNEQGDIIDDYNKVLSLIREFRKSDVKKALFSIPGTKSPGLDGYGSKFYKAMWQHIGDDISEAILEFFHYGKIPVELNETVLALVPKTDMPSKVFDDFCSSTGMKANLKATFISLPGPLSACQKLLEDWVSVRELSGTRQCLANTFGLLVTNRRLCG